MAQDKMDRKARRRIGKYLPLIKAVIFCAIFLVLFVHLSYILRPYDGSASRQVVTGFYAEEEDSLDVVFVGSSSVFSFWEPMEAWNSYGFTSANFATGTLPIQLMRYELEEIGKTQDPLLYVIDLRPFSIAHMDYYLEPGIQNIDHEVPLRTTTDNMKYSWTRFKAIRDGVPDSYDKIPYYIDLIKYHTEWDRLIDEESLSYWRNETRDYRHGFKMVNYFVPQEHEDWTDDETRAQLSEQQSEALEEILSYCNEQNLQAVFLVNCYCQWQSDKELYNTLIDRIEEAGYTALNTNDYYEEIGVDFKRDYYDASHTNIFGADKYTAFVAEYLNEHFDLPDHRQDEAYAQWDEDYVLWTQEADAVKVVIQQQLDAAYGVEEETE